MNTPIEQIKSLLRDVPEDIVNGYIKDILLDLGWSDNLALNLHIFTQPHIELGSLSLYEFSNLDWQNHVIFLNENSLHPDSKTAIKSLISNHVQNRDTVFSGHITNSRTRFDRAMEHIKGTGRLPARIVLVRTNGLFVILDGHHRVSALFSLNIQDKTPIDSWIADL